MLYCIITLIIEGKPAAEVSQVHLGEIHALKEELKNENDRLKDTKQQLRDLQDRIKAEEEETKVQSSLLQGNAELRERIQADERERLERENAAILKEKLDNLKLEIEQEKAEVKVNYTQSRNCPQHTISISYKNKFEDIVLSNYRHVYVVILLHLNLMKCVPKHF